MCQEPSALKKRTAFRDTLFSGKLWFSRFEQNDKFLQFYVKFGKC